jgi:hypothetical protein
MGIWKGTNIGNVFAGTPTSAFLGIYDRSSARTFHPAMYNFAVGDEALPKYRGAGELVLDEAELNMATATASLLRLRVWGDYEGAAKLATIRSGETSSPQAYSEVWSAKDALLDITTARVAWIIGGAIDHPLAMREKRLRKLIANEMPDGLSVGHIRFEWIKRLAVGTDKHGHPFALIDALDHCLVDSPRPVRVLLRFEEADREAMHRLGGCWSEFVGKDTSKWITDWSDLDEPNQSLRIANKSAHPV